MRATIEGAVTLDPVTDDSNAAMIAGGGELMDRTLEAVENVTVSRGNHLEREVIIVTADLASSHIYLRVREAGNRLRRRLHPAGQRHRPRGFHLSVSESLVPGTVRGVGFIGVIEALSPVRLLRRWPQMA